MEPRIQDFLRANVVFVGLHLVNESAGFNAFRDSVGSEVVAEGGIVVSLQGAGPTQANRFQLPKDRIILECTSQRSTVIREYPTQQDLGRIAEISKLAADNTNKDAQSIRAFGFSIELVYEQFSKDNALGYLAKRIFSSKLFRDDDFQLLGGTGNLIFENESRRWTAKFEPRFNDTATKKVFMSLNCHVEEPRMPNEDEILEHLSNTWKQAVQLVTRIHQNAP